MCLKDTKYMYNTLSFQLDALDLQKVGRARAASYHQQTLCPHMNSTRILVT